MLDFPMSVSESEHLYFILGMTDNNISSSDIAIPVGSGMSNTDVGSVETLELESSNESEIWISTMKIYMRNKTFYRNWTNIYQTQNPF